MSEATKPESTPAAGRPRRRCRRARRASASSADVSERPRGRPSTEAVFELDGLGVLYGGKQAVQDVTFDLYTQRDHRLHRPVRLRQVDDPALPEPDERPRPERDASRARSATTARTSTTPKVDAVEVRKRIGMVFQKPNPFPKSIYDNIAFGPKVLGMKGDMDEIVERALRRAALWDEVKDRLKTNAFGMSGGQQQRLCIARCLAVDPDVILMDEPCSALDPISTGKIEDLMIELKEQYSIVIVTHNMQQAARVSDRTAFFIVDLSAGEGNRIGRLVEYDATEKIFTNPSDSRTEDYVTGKVG